MPESPSFTTIRFDSSEGIARIVLDRPHVLNALDPVMVRELFAAMDHVEQDEDIKVVVISGEGRAFSAGFDLKASAARGMLTPFQWRQTLEEDLDLVMRFWDCAKPTIAAVHGYCIGGAFEIALGCDVTIAGESTLMGEPEVRFGSGIVAMLLPWITGPKLAKEILLTGEDRLSAQRALQLGIVNHVVPDAELSDAATAMAERIRAAAPLSVKLTKNAINRTYDTMGLRQALLQSLEIDIFLESAVGPERETFNRIRKEEGLQAALAWRNGRSVG
jgi:enoyl-CoA hydratase